MNSNGFAKEVGELVDDKKFNRSIDHVACFCHTWVTSGDRGIGNRDGMARTWIRIRTQA